MSGDPYIKENEELEAEIARLQHCIAQIEDELVKKYYFDESVRKLQKERDKLRTALERIADLYGYEAEANAVAIAREALAKEGK